jgi:hypothetical protein
VVVRSWYSIVRALEVIIRSRRRSQRSKWLLIARVSQVGEIAR